MFELSNRRLAYGNAEVLGDVSLCIQAGERVALVGPSGAGKTTLLRALYQQFPDQIALCPQHYGLVDTLSVYHNIYMGQLDRHSALYNAWNLVRPIAGHRTNIAGLAGQLGLAEKLDHSVDQLSGGQRQRVAIGRALYRQCPVFIGDEPVSSLDATQGQAILDHILQQHTTAVVALHNRRMALTAFDRVIALKAGAILWDRAAKDIQTDEIDALYAE